MPRYTKVHANYWNSKIGRAASACGPQGHQIYLYLRSGEQGNYIGLYKFNAGYAAVDLAIPASTVMEYIEKFEAAGLVAYSPAIEVLWIIDQAEEQVGELKNGDKKIVAVNKDVAAIERSLIRDAFFIKYHQFLKLHATLAPRPSAATATLTPTTAEVIPTPAEQSRAAMQEASAEGHFEGLLSALLAVREADRKHYSEVRDLCVREDVEIIRQKLGIRHAADIIRNSIATGDLGLVQAMAALTGSTC
ncbi:hypothetical protein JAB6_29330 [Janthinobacterium sp. HH104]|uniref:hypothetical protein n=1 Tax=Janthinobacterium sp. HH104 TaxID=1537276 RepID=UPI0008736A9B|nr:hypothetical protein [Janthinobacterium sp. HH104]OEZ83356.1 hypothetical protein JAB6_29330 [Janthinobacterium sp. HH104]